MPHIALDSVGNEVATITRGLEDRLANAIRTGNGFENWWKFEIIMGFCDVPWNRMAGPAIDGDNDVGVTAESKFWLANSRNGYTRTTGRDTKRIDIELRAATSGAWKNKSHLIELKVLCPKTIKRSEQSLRQDMDALKATADEWVASAWVLALCHSFGGSAEEALKRATNGVRVPNDPRHYRIAARGIEGGISLYAYRLR